MSRRLDISNKTFNRLTAIKFVKSNKDRNSVWLFKCKCGTKKKIVAYRVKNNSIKSCGCWHIESTGKRFRKHGQRQSRLYSIWCGMKARCYNIKHKRYKDYGGRRIKVCKQWKNNFQTFYDWSMKNGYKSNLTIDRKENDKGYNPKNCRWITYKSQANNKRNNHLVTYQGRTQTIVEWSEELSINRRKLNYQINSGLKLEEILNPMKYKGLDGKDYSITFSSKKQKNKSKYHLIARELLATIYPLDPIFEEVYLAGSHTSNNKGLYADFFIPSQKLIIEVNGAQHYEYNSFHHQNKLQFYKSQAKDRVKREWCEINGITLIELKYDDSHNWRTRIENSGEMETGRTSTE